MSTKTATYEERSIIPRESVNKKHRLYNVDLDNNRRIETPRSTSKDIFSLKGDHVEGLHDRERTACNQQVPEGLHYSSPSLNDNSTIHHLPSIPYTQQPAKTIKSLKRHLNHQNEARMLFNNGNISTPNHHLLTGSIMGSRSGYKNYLDESQSNSAIQAGTMPTDYRSDAITVQQISHGPENFGTKIDPSFCSDYQPVSKATTITSYRQPTLAHTQHNRQTPQSQHHRGVKRHSDSTAKKPSASTTHCSTDAEQYLHQHTSDSTMIANKKSTQKWATTASQNLNKANQSLASGDGQMEMDQVNQSPGSSGGGAVGLNGSNYATDQTVQNDNDNNNGDEDRDNDDDYEAEEDNDQFNYEPILTKILNEKKLVSIASVLRKVFKNRTDLTNSIAIFRKFSNIRLWPRHQN